MANGIIELFEYYGDERLEGRIVWNSTTNVTNNTSTIEFTTQIRKSSSLETWGTWKFTLEVLADDLSDYRDDWRQVMNINRDIYKSVGASWVTLDTRTVTVTHTASGEQILHIFATVNAPTGTNLEGIELMSNASGWGYEIELDKIRTYAKLYSAPNFNNTENPTIVYNNYAGDAADSLQACIASANGSVIYVPYRDIPKTNAKTSYTFNLTAAERQALRQAVTSGSSIPIRFYVRTVVGDKTNRVYLDRTFTLVGNAPTLSPTVEDINAITLALTGDKNKLIRYYSNASYKINGVADEGATIVSQSVTNGGQVKTAASGVMYAVEHDNFVFNVTDSRGLTTEKVVTKTMIPYFKLSCDLNANVASTDGVISYTIKGSYYNGSFGAVSNSLTIQYRYKKSGDEYSAWGYLDGNTLKFDDLYRTYTATGSLMIPNFDYKTSYAIQVKVADKLASIESNEYSVRLYPVFDWGENDFNFNVPVKLSEGVTDGSKTYNLIGLAKAMSSRYSLPCTVTARNGYSSASAQLYLYGNTIRGYLRVKRSANLAPNTLTSAEPVCSIEFDSGGKVVGFGEVGFASGLIGNVATFQMTDGYIYPDDGSVSEESVGKGTFVVRICNTAVSDNEWSAMFTFPCLIDLGKY